MTPDPAAIPVAVSGFTWTSGLVFVLNLLVGGGIVGGIIKVWPMLKKLANDREAAIAAGRREDMDDMRERIIALEGKVETASTAAIKAQMQMTYVTAALGMVSAELERRDPGNPVIKQARDLVAQATHEDPPFGKLVQSLNNARGVGE